VRVLGIDADCRFILLNGQLQDFPRPTRLGIAERTQVNSPQKLVGFQVVGIALDDLLSFENGVAYAASAVVDVSQSGIQVLRRRVGGNRQPVFLDGLVGVLAAPVHGHHLFVHVGQSEVVVRRRMVNLSGRRVLVGSWGRLRRGIFLRRRRLRRSRLFLGQSR